MSSINTISVEQLTRLIGTPKCPQLFDVRADDAFASDPRLIPGASRRSAQSLGVVDEALRGRSAVVICEDGGKLSHGAAALLRQAGLSADVLDGGIQAWKEAAAPLVPEAKIPSRDPEGRTVWVTRERPKVDRIACPWLIRRFIDPAAQFLFVKASEVLAVAEQFGATPFDMEGVFWGHRGELCTFDIMVEEFALGTKPLLRLAAIVRGADTARLDLAPETAGLLAVSLGLSRMFDDDLAQLDAGMLLYDSFYRWSRDAVGETHSSPGNRGRRPR
jgi:rhodanese-related sulfurtransferase